MSGRQLLFTVFYACSVFFIAGQAGAQEQAVLERDAALLAEPRNGAPVVAQLKQGTSGEVIARKAAWVNLKTPSGTGWMFSFNVRFQAAGTPAARTPVGAVATRRAPITPTIGIRGLDEEDLRQAHYDDAQMQLLDGYAASKQDGDALAASSGLSAVRVNYLDKR